HLEEPALPIGPGVDHGHLSWLGESDDQELIHVVRPFGTAVAVQSSAIGAVGIHDPESRHRAGGVVWVHQENHLIAGRRGSRAVAMPEIGHPRPAALEVEYLEPRPEVPQRITVSGRGVEVNTLAVARPSPGAALTNPRLGLAGR